MVDKMSSKWCS
uniref:Uncharacterized protein n=1 Tax=Oryza meridionalis TaxID=40149 RepID=A0A0E0F953_9ORYZ